MVNVRMEGEESYLMMLILVHIEQKVLNWARLMMIIGLYCLICAEMWLRENLGIGGDVM